MYAIIKNNKRLAYFNNLHDAQANFALIVANECGLEVGSTFFDGVVIADGEGLIKWSKNDKDFYFLYGDDEFEIEEIKV